MNYFIAYFNCLNFMTNIRKRTGAEYRRDLNMRHSPICWKIDVSFESLYAVLTEFVSCGTALFQ